MFSYYTHNDKSMKEQVEKYQYQDNQIPKNIFLIWIGDDIPSTTARPYLQNIIKHKILNPSAKVQVLVNKEKLNSNLIFLQDILSEYGVILRDVDETCHQYINYDLVKQFMRQKNEYVLASDFLRLALLFHEGGWYFDTDITPNMPIENTKPKYGFYQYYRKGNFSDNPFCFQAAVQWHSLYLYASVVSRYFYETFKATKPEWFDVKFVRYRQALISYISGNPLSSLRHETNLNQIYNATQIQHFSYPLEKTCNVSFDASWLDDYPFIDCSPADLKLLKNQFELLNDFFRATSYKLRQENYINELSKAYFSKIKQTEIKTSWSFLFPKDIFACAKVNKKTYNELKPLTKKP